MARLSVNLNKIALLRNSRYTGVPDVLKFARLAIDAGVAGITVHPRPDQRHIRRADVPALAKLMRPLRPKLELNIEGYPDTWIFDICEEVRPEQCTLVPDPPGAFTSEKGWDLTAEQLKVVVPAIKRLKKLGARVILFIDPDPAVVGRVARAGADGIEIYTGGYAAAFKKGTADALLEACGKAADEARKHGLVVNVGHDLNLLNLPPLVARIPILAEASIGHELTADALAQGFPSTIRAYAAALAPRKVERLHEEHAARDPLVLFKQWFAAAGAAGVLLPNAMTVATATKKGVPSARTVLLKDFDRKGFVFYTNYDSRKGRELAQNPKAELVFHWVQMERQIRISGEVKKASRAEVAKYFATRPRESQLSAWASEQSAVIEGRASLEKEMEKLRKKYEGKKIPLPPHWGGYRVMPTAFEFWQGQAGRLHDRLRYIKSRQGAWKLDRLSP